MATAMKLRFDANQEYQLDAIASVVDLFEGQRRVETGQAVLQLGQQGTAAAVANQLDLTEEDLLVNLQRVQERNGLRVDSELALITRLVESDNGSREVSFPNFTVEMETGTGKTYVYLRTILELFQRYGLRKFIIVVPSVAIREGCSRACRSPRITSVNSTKTPRIATACMTRPAWRRCGSLPCRTAWRLW